MSFMIVDVYYNPEVQRITLFCQTPGDLFDYCYQNRMRGQVVRKKYSDYEFNYLKQTIPEVYRMEKDIFVLL